MNNTNHMDNMPSQRKRSNEPRTIQEFQASLDQMFVQNVYTDTTFIDMVKNVLETATESTTIIASSTSIITLPNTYVKAQDSLNIFYPLKTLHLVHDSVEGKAPSFHNNCFTPAVLYAIIYKDNEKVICSICRYTGVETKNSNEHNDNYIKYFTVLQEEDYEQILRSKVNQNSIPT